MKITCIDKEIKKVFETGYYQIPRFQRPYSWEKDQISEFWEDSIVENESDYFIGSIVVFKKGNEHYGIVDGQQRLTTITMILCALREFYVLESFENFALGVQKLIEKVDLDNQSYYILQTETSYPYFQEYIQKYDSPDIEVEYGQEELNLKNGFELIRSFIKQEIDQIKSNNKIPKAKVQKELEKKLNSIRDRILQLKVIYIELDDEDDAYVIFETLNTRGKDLGVGDLVKNYLIKNVKISNKGVDIPKEKWTLIRNNIDSTTKELDIDTFLLHVWLSRYEHTTTKTLFKKLKKTIKASAAKAFLDNLVIDSVNYKNIFDTDTRKWIKNELPIKDSLKALFGFGVTQQTPMVLSIMREYNAGNLKYSYAKEALEAIEHFHFIFTAVTSQRSSGGVASMYSTYARKLLQAKTDVERINVVRELKKKMSEKIPTLGEFIAAFKTLLFLKSFTKQKKLVHYILSKFDKFYNTNGSSINYDAMTIEHILPQNPSNKTIFHLMTIGRVGNLILVDEKTNTKLSNKDFMLKQQHLKDTNLFLGSILMDAKSWTEKEIDERTVDIATKAYTKVFKI